MLVFAPALSPAALAYNAKSSGPDASARLILPDWDRLDGGIDPFDGNLIPRRAMENPRDGMSDILWWGAAGACIYFGCSPALTWMVWGGAGVSSVSARSRWRTPAVLQHTPETVCTCHDWREGDSQNGVS